MSTPLYLSATLRQIESSHQDKALMSRAGKAVADWAAELLGNNRAPILILAGPGNNGGDAFVAASLLRAAGHTLHVQFADSPLPPDARQAHAEFIAAGGTTHNTPIPDLPWGLVIDGIFGIGLGRAPGAPFAAWINTVNRLSCPVLALDCPSGLVADSGKAFSPVIQATHTLSFIAAKPGLYSADGPDLCGEIRIADLDLPDLTEQANGWIVDRQPFADYLKPRLRNSHKGSFGSVGILGGSKSMLGAALLSGRAALKLGSGRVYLGLLDPEAPTVDLVQPELMLRRADTLLSADLRALACGPGLGQSGEAIRLLEQALKAPLPLVLDADALNILASDGRLEGNLYTRVAPVILTPHPAEAARLLGCAVPDIQNDRIAAACQLARDFRSVVVLKGCGSVIATVDGQWWINTTGNPGMASAGMGDVLTGLIVALLGQGWPAPQAALAATHLHGSAADRLVAENCGPIGLSAGETIEAARRVFNDWVNPNLKK